MYRVFISVGDRDQGPGIEVLRTHLGKEGVGVIDCEPSLGDHIILHTGMYVPGTRYFFVTVVYIARNIYT